MNLPNFFALRQAIASLDVNFIADRIAQLERTLVGRGQILEAENTAFTEEGIYYIEPESGMTTKVILYLSDQQMTFAVPPRSVHAETGYGDIEIIQKFHRYHLVRCNILLDERLHGWTSTHRITQRPDGLFYYRLVSPGKYGTLELKKEIERQRLLVCPNCYFKVTSLIEGVDALSEYSFVPQHFFDIDSAGSWCRYDRRNEDTRTFSDLYPKDWAEICAIRMKQVHYHCEACNRDLSAAHARRFLTVQHTDHMKRNIGYVRLECLCVACMAERPNGAHLRKLPLFQEFQRFEKTRHQRPERQPQRL